jgi:tetratricopeptide (TPR) repeat protein
MVPDYQDDLAITLLNIAIMHNHRQEFTNAVALIEQARRHHKAVLKASPRDQRYRRGYQQTLRVLAWSQYGLGDHVHLAATADELAQFEFDPPNHACHAVRYLCICVSLANKDARLDPARRKELAKVYADKAMTLLREAATRDSKDRTRLEYRQSIASCYLDVGNLLSADRQPKQAEAAYGGAIELWKQLAKDFPNRPDILHDLARSHHDLGVFLYDGRRPKEAEVAYRAAVAIRKQLVKEFAKRTDFRQDLARSHNNLGNVLYTTGRLKEAEAAYRDALPLQEKLAADFPNVQDYQNGLAGTLVNLGMVHHQRREYAAAVPFLEQARPHHQAALKASPKDRTYRLFYHNNLSTLTGSHLHLGDHARLATTAEELARFRYDPANDTYKAGCLLCRCATLAEKDPRLDEAKRKEFARRYADQALALLRRAVSRGYKNAAEMRGNADLKPLQGREDFKKLLAELEK